MTELFIGNQPENALPYSTQKLLQQHREILEELREIREIVHELRGLAIRLEITSAPWRHGL